MPVKVPCPLCGGLIDPNDIDWVCPSCGFENKHGSIMENCESCNTSIQDMRCPHCNKKFEAIRLLFNEK